LKIDEKRQNGSKILKGRWVNMSGLYDRLTGPDSLNVHYFGAGFVGYAAGDWTGQQVLDALNNLLVTPLSGAEVTDLNAIVAEVDSKVGATEKMIYALRLDAACLAVEVGQIGETAWRTMLGIS
jgi:hypothetical protein